MASFLLVFVLLILPSAFSLPLCADLRAPVTPKAPLSFCSYDGNSCCNATDDSNLQKLFVSMNISDASCGSLLKSILCTGMRTVISMKEMEKEVEMRDEFHNLTEGIKNSETDNFSSNRTCTPFALIDFQEEMKIVGPFTAPF